MQTLFQYGNDSTSFLAEIDTLPDMPQYVLHVAAVTHRKETIFALGTGILPHNGKVIGFCVGRLVNIDGKTVAQVDWRQYTASCEEGLTIEATIAYSKLLLYAVDYMESSKKNEQ